MSQNELNWLLTQVVSGLFGVLILVLGWIGVRIHNRLDAINETLRSFERDLREELVNLDRRITRVEGHIEACPARREFD